MPDWLAELEERLGGTVGRAVLLAGGASKEAWAIHVGEEELLVRRAAGGVIHIDTLTLAQEYRVLEAAHEAGVRVPRPHRYLGELGGREAFAMERVAGETIGRRIVQRPELAAARAALPLHMAEQLAKVHAIPVERLDFLPGAPGGVDLLARLRGELDTVDEPHPAIELGLRWLDERLPAGRPAVVNHGDFRLGNLVVGEHGLVSVLDWEFAHVSDPAEDVAWPLVRAWRFGVDGLRLGGVGEVAPYLERYNELSGQEIGLEELATWEVLGNVKWAVGALTQSRRHLSGQERSVELAVLGRLAAEMEYELLHLIERSA
ncbi:MAG: phosphotransferase family protein [Actinobacteria bacterium]|nr:phosphotransferase family protein [Actinomycetota bacterium]